jgi:hypothetical protein
MILTAFIVMPKEFNDKKINYYFRENMEPMIWPIGV